MPAPPAAPGTINVASKKLGKSALTLAPLPDGRMVVTAVKKGISKELVPGMVVNSIAGEGQDVSYITSSEQGEEQRKMAVEAGKIVTIAFNGVVATGKKTSKDGKVGLSLRREPELGIVVRKIEEDSIFANSPLKVGQIVTQVGKVPCPMETKDVIEILKKAKKGSLTLVAVDRADGAPPIDYDDAAPEAAPAPVLLPPPKVSDHHHPPEPISPSESEDDYDAPAPKDDVSHKATAEPEHVKPAQSHDEDETAKDDSDDVSTSDGKVQVDSKRQQHAKDERRDVESSEEKKVDGEGGTWLCCAY